MWRERRLFSPFPCCIFRDYSLLSPLCVILFHLVHISGYQLLRTTVNKRIIGTQFNEKKKILGTNFREWLNQNDLLLVILKDPQLAKFGNISTRENVSNEKNWLNQKLIYNGNTLVQWWVAGGGGEGMGVWGLMCSTATLDPQVQVIHWDFKNGNNQRNGKMCTYLKGSSKRPSTFGNIKLLLNFRSNKFYMYITNILQNRCVE